MKNCKNCKNCKYAEWQRASNGRLHQSGNGWCTYKAKRHVGQLSISIESHALGSFINRRAEFNADCPCYEAKK